jgi:PPM family protein phosphatase
VHVSTHPVDEATRYLVCTDGLSDVIDNAEIATVLEANRGAAVFELWKAAITGGGPDNITVVLAEIVSVEVPSETRSTSST